MFASEGAPPVLVSTTSTAKFPPVSMTPAANLPLVSTTPAENFATSFTSVVGTGDKFAAGVVDNRWQRHGWQIAMGVSDTGGKQWEQYQAADTLMST
jgi:hypothetical protein